MPLYAVPENELRGLIFPAFGVGGVVLPNYRGALLAVLTRIMQRVDRCAAQNVAFG